MCAQAMAKFYQSGTQRSNATNYTAATIQGWYNSTPKASPFVVHSTSGTPTVSQFQLKAAGVWEIVMNHQFSAACSIYICRTTAALANKRAGCGSVINANVTLLDVFDFNAVIMPLWTTPAGTMDQTNDQCNFISFLYHGPI
jgi:hypothetical protein